jgi:hypothetical protein
MDRTVTFNIELISGLELQTGLDTKTDRLTDCQSQSDPDSESGYAMSGWSALWLRFVSSCSFKLSLMRLSPLFGQCDSAMSSWLKLSGDAQRLV